MSDTMTNAEVQADFNLVLDQAYHDAAIRRESLLILMYVATQAKKIAKQDSSSSDPSELRVDALLGTNPDESERVEVVPSSQAGGWLAEHGKWAVRHVVFGQNIPLGRYISVSTQPFEVPEDLPPTADLGKLYAAMDDSAVKLHDGKRVGMVTEPLLDGVPVVDALVGTEASLLDLIADTEQRISELKSA